MNAGRVYLGDRLSSDYDVFEFDGRVTDAWSLIGATGEFRLRGGRAFYTEVFLRPGRGEAGDRVSIERIDPTPLRVIRRAVEPEQEVEVFEVDGDTAHNLGWIGPLRWTEDGEPYREEVGS